MEVASQIQMSVENRVEGGAEVQDSTMGEGEGSMSIEENALKMTLHAAVGVAENGAKIFRLLPEDVLERVFSFLPVHDVFRYRLVCRRCNEVLTSHRFLRAYDGRDHQEKWITVFDGLGFLDERAVLLYDTAFHRWRQISLAFLPAQFDIVVAAAGGLLCAASKAVDKNVMCICNPFTKTYKELPDLQLELVQPHAIMERKDDGSYTIYVMSSNLLAVYDSENEHWVYVNIGEPVRPRSPVICDGAMYGLRDEGSLWWQSWKLVFSNLGTLSDVKGRLRYGVDIRICLWAVLSQREWGEIPALVRHPRLLGANGCLLLIGGLKKSVLSYSCSTFIIFKFDFITLEWLEIAKMPKELYWGFEDTALVKIFGSTHDVFFLCKGPETMVVCSLSNGEVVWRRIVDCPDYKYCVWDLCKGFSFDLKLGSMP